MQRLISNATRLAILTLLLINSPIARALDLHAQIDPLAKQLIDDHTVVGLVIGVYQDGQTQILSYGETKKDAGVAPDGDTIYEIGSASKVFTGALLADMVERGRVKLDDPMQTHLPPATKAQLKNPTGITFEDLATQTSGLPALPENFQPANMENPYADYTHQRLFAFLKDHQPRRPPGEYEYSNLGMGLLGVLLASREKSPYEKLLVEHIATPCGMDDTRIKLTAKQRQRLAPPYDATLQPAKNWDVPTLAGAGAIRSTANDMLKFIAANLAKDDKPLTKAAQLAHQKRRDIPGGGAIGLAWHIAGDGATRWHNGRTGGYASWVSIVPDRNVGVVILANTSAEEITELGLRINLVALGKKVEPAPRPAQVEVAPEVLKKYEGVYAISPDFSLTVTLEGKTLMVQGTGQQKLKVEPETETKFACKLIDAHLTFVPEKDGRPEVLILHQSGQNVAATRQN